MEIAFLLTCYNRRELTIRCLEALHVQIANHPEHHCQIILCDDNSKDGTVMAVQSAFPDTEIICTSGNNFWCKGMYIAMQNAYARKYQLYFMINDIIIKYDFFQTNNYERFIELYERMKVPKGVISNIENEYMLQKKIIKQNEKEDKIKYEKENVTSI